jgi:hypothetical protein
MRARNTASRGSGPLYEVFGALDGVLSSQQIQRAVDGQRVEHVSVAPHHGLGLKERIQRSLFRGYDHSLELMRSSFAIQPRRTDGREP